MEATKEKAMVKMKKRGRRSKGKVVREKTGDKLNMVNFLCITTVSPSEGS